MAKNVHVTYRKDENKWAVVREGNDRASSLHDTQWDAIDSGRDIARNNRVELVIHDQHNRIRDKDSYGNDPYPPRDRKH